MEEEGRGERGTPTHTYTYKEKDTERQNEKEGDRDGERGTERKRKLTKSEIKLERQPTVMRVCVCVRMHACVPVHVYMLECMCARV